MINLVLILRLKESIIGTEKQVIMSALFADEILHEKKFNKYKRKGVKIMKTIKSIFALVIALFISIDILA